jgi:hypothetical protein
MSKSFIERRDHARESINLPVEISHDGKSIQGEIHDLSHSGAKIQAVRTFDAGSFIGLEFESPRAALAMLKAANIVWTRENMMGIRFVPSEMKGETEEAGKEG